MKRAIRRLTCCHCLPPSRLNADASAGPGLEPARLAAEFCPRTP
ncbi:hypothetical protein [Streptomyces sp. NBC_01451]|nr:hypothetical protein [Streptomyces sp. NBC_01451]